MKNAKWNKFRNMEGNGKETSSRRYASSNPTIIPTRITCIGILIISVACIITLIAFRKTSIKNLNLTGNNSQGFLYITTCPNTTLRSVYLNGVLTQGRQQTSLSKSDFELKADDDIGIETDTDEPATPSSTKKTLQHLPTFNFQPRMLNGAQHPLNTNRSSTSANGVDEPVTTATKMALILLKNIVQPVSKPKHVPRKIGGRFQRDAMNASDLVNGMSNHSESSDSQTINNSDKSLNTTLTFADKLNDPLYENTTLQNVFKASTSAPDYTTRHSSNLSQITDHLLNHSDGEINGVLMKVGVSEIRINSTLDLNDSISLHFVNKPTNADNLSVYFNNSNELNQLNLFVDHKMDPSETLNTLTAAQDTSNISNLNQDTTVFTSPPNETAQSNYFYPEKRISQEAASNVNETVENTHHQHKSSSPTLSQTDDKDQSNNKTEKQHLNLNFESERTIKKAVNSSTNKTSTADKPDDSQLTLDYNDNAGLKAASSIILEHVYELKDGVRLIALEVEGDVENSPCFKARLSGKFTTTAEVFCTCEKVPSLWFKMKFLEDLWMVLMNYMDAGNLGFAGFCEKPGGNATVLRCRKYIL